MNAFDYLRNLHDVCQFQTREGARIGKASNSELKRWIKNGAVVINHYKVTDPLEEIDYPIHRLWLFPNNRVTLV